MTESAAVERWLAGYVAAWRSYDPDEIGELFADDAEYRYYPTGEPLRGRQAIVDSWLAERDPPGSWEAEYRPLIVHGDTVVVRGQTRYTSGKVYENLWLVEFDGDGRCRSFEEWWMEPPRRDE